MPVYRYTAARSGQRSALTRGELTADSPVQVRRALRRAGLNPVRVDAAADVHRISARNEDAIGSVDLAGAERRPVPRRRGSRGRSGRTAGALVEFYESLAALLASGLPLAGALETVARSQTAARHAALGTLCRELAEDLARGESLAGAMAARPGWFRDVDRALVRAAEESGELERALSDLAEHHARGEELRGRLAAALSYPALLCAFGLGVVVFLTTTTLPPLVQTLQDAGVEPPAATKILMVIGAAFARWWWLAMGVVVVTAAIVHRARSSAGSRPGAGASSTKLSRRLLRVPLLGAALSRAELGSACVMLARLLDGGVTLADALSLTAPTVRNGALRSAFEALRARLIEGRSFRVESAEAESNAARTSGGSDSAELPEDIVRVLEVGRESGELPRALRTLGERRLRSARRLIDRLAAVLEPAVILLLAALIGLVVYAAIAPMLRLAQTL